MNVDGEMRATEWNKAVEAIRSLRVLQSYYIRPEITRAGTLLNITEEHGSGKGGLRGPWDLLSEGKAPTGTGTEVTKYEVTVSPGLMNTTLAENWDEKFEVSANTLFYAIAKVSTDGEVTTVVEIKINTTGLGSSTAQSEPYTIADSVELLFGVGYNSNVQRTIAIGNIRLVPTIWLITDADPPASAGESPYDIYYELI